MSAELLALLDSDPAAGILAVADLREERQGAAYSTVINEVVDKLRADAYYDTAEHIAAEANPAHALAAVRRWRGVAERHRSMDDTHPLLCEIASEAWPCPDILETADEARAYLGGAS